MEYPETMEKGTHGDITQRPDYETLWNNTKQKIKSLIDLCF